MRRSLLLALALPACAPTDADDSGTAADIAVDRPYTVVGTDQATCYGVDGSPGCPAAGEDLYGQDAQHVSVTPDTEDNGDGTVTDWNTGLVWEQQQRDDIAWADAEGSCDALSLGGRDDWRVPTTKELYSLILFSGSTGTAAPEGDLPADAVPYIDDSVFDFRYGDMDAGERYIDTQFISSTVYVDRVFSDDDGKEAGQQAFFGVNYADGRIKGYPTEGLQTWQLRCVAGNPDYGENDLSLVGDDIVADAATGLEWTRADSGGLGGGMAGDGSLDWGQALALCEDLELGGHDDWRLPHAKELQSIVDYGRSPDTTGTAALDPLFAATPIVNEDGHDDFGWYWSSTTHLDGMNPGDAAVYVAFGQALGLTQGFATGQELYLDVHGAGAQRSDPKAGDPGDYPQGGMGPQGDVRRVFNLARCVRDAD